MLQNFSYQLFLIMIIYCFCVCVCVFISVECHNVTIRFKSFLINSFHYIYSDEEERTMNIMYTTNLIQSF